MKPIPIRHRAALGLVLFCFAALPLAAQDAADPFDLAKAAFMAAEGVDDRVAIVKEFLADHPNDAAVGEVLQAGADMYVQALDDRPAAVGMAENQLDVTTDPDGRAAIREVLMGLYAMPAYSFKLETLVKDHYDSSTMTYGKHLDVLEAAAGAHW